MVNELKFQREWDVKISGQILIRKHFLDYHVVNVSA